MKRSISKYRSYTHSDLVQSIKSLSRSTLGENEALELALQKVELATRTNPPTVTPIQMLIPAIVLASVFTFIIVISSDYLNNVRGSVIYSRLALLFSSAFVPTFLASYLYVLHLKRANKKRVEADASLALLYDTDDSLILNSNDAQVLVKHKEDFDLLALSEIYRALGVFGFTMLGVRADQSPAGRLKMIRALVLLTGVVIGMIYVKFFM